MAPKKVRQALDHVEEVVSAVVLMFMAILAFANVSVRYLTTLSLAFSEELQVNLFVWLTLFGAAIAIRRKALLAITVLVNALPIRLKMAAAVFSGVMTVGLFGLLFLHGADLVRSEMASGMTTYSMGLPMWWFALGIPVGTLFCIWRMIEATVKSLRELSARARGRKAEEVVQAEGI